jgi:hypothetical protein
VALSQLQGYTLFFGNGKENSHLGIGSVGHNLITRTDKRMGFVSDKMLLLCCVVCCWCDISTLNMHASTVDKSDGTKYSFYEETTAYTSSVS